MRILHICETARGGVGTYIDTLIELEKPFAQSRVVIPDTHRSILGLDVDAAIFPYERRSVGALLKMLRVALRERLNFKPDIIFCHSTFSLLALLLLRPISPNVQFIYCAHGWAGAREMANHIKAKLIRLAERYLARLAHRVVNVSQSDLQHANSYGYRGAQVLIENAVRPVTGEPSCTLFGRDPNLVHLLFVGRHDRQKGLDILLEAYADARLDRPDLRLHVIGEAVVSEQADVYPTEGVNFLGWIGADNIDGYYRSADLVVMPSRWEGLPLVIPEALRNGTPVLVSDRSNLPSLIERHKSGLVFELSSAALSKILHQLDKEKLQAMRPACLKLFNRRYHSDRLGKQISMIYNELMKR